MALRIKVASVSLIVTRDPSRRVRVVVNCAMSADGKIALKGGGRLRLSGPEDKARVERLRRDSDCILVGINTVLADDPSLLVETGLPPGRETPLRAILDTRLRTPRDARLLKGGRTIIFTGRAGERLEGAEVVALPTPIAPIAVVAELEKRGARVLLVEGGGEVIASFLASGLVDEFHTYVAPLIVGGRGAPTPAGGVGANSLETMWKLELVSATRLGEGALLSYRARK
ncbi:MAG: dihydrofolate reductase family protein [Euryarchaeota archaeon]|nr:dihydrofolate reductase family protein [Euryarchaeota archaeon]